MLLDIVFTLEEKTTPKHINPHFTCKLNVKKTRFRRLPIYIVHHIRHQWYLRYCPYPQRRGSAGRWTRKAEVYRNALVVAWRSGVLTSSEKHLIDALKEHLGVTDKEHNSMEEKIINNIDPIRRLHLGLYEEI